MKQKILLLFLFLGIITTACTQKSSQNEIQFSDMNKDLSCLDSSEMPSEMRAKGFIINSNDEYQLLLVYQASRQECKNIELPAIDFSEHTLLGRYAQGGGCSVDFAKKIYKDSLNKKITYSIQVSKEGLCKKLVESMNWVLIPKVPSGYGIEFRIS